MQSRKIGVFDSGFGGLTVLKELVNKLPQYDYLYLGDSARAPYGSRSQDLIYEFTEQAVDYLFRNDCEIIILACNTASAEALRKIQQSYLPKHHPDKRVLGVIIPTVEQVVDDAASAKVGVLATEGTVQSETYIKEIAKLDSSIEVIQSAAPLLVPLIEAGEVAGEDIEMHINDYIEPLLRLGVDSLILGCTHYALIECEIRRLLPNHINIYNQSSIVAEKMANYLAKHWELAERLGTGASIRYLSTDCNKKFSEFGSKIMGKKIKAEKVVIAK